ncbi:MAG: hypothetical protein QME42_11310 [bacterium]|nr:hypothetical protein [bacterium]
MSNTVSAVLEKIESAFRLDENDDESSRIKKEPDKFKNELLNRLRTYKAVAIRSPIPIIPLVNYANEVIEKVEKKERMDVGEFLNFMSDKCASLRQDMETKRKKAIKQAGDLIEKGKIVVFLSGEKSDLSTKFIENSRKTWHRTRIISTIYRREEDSIPFKLRGERYEEEYGAEREIESEIDKLNEIIIAGRVNFVITEAYIGSKEGGTLCIYGMKEIASMINGREIPFYILEDSFPNNYPQDILKNMVEEFPVMKKYCDFLPSEYITGIINENGILKP